MTQVVNLLTSEIVKDRSKKPKDSLKDFIQELSLRVDKSEDSYSDSIQLMTIHAAKGKEFEVVFIPGLEEGIIPSRFAIESRQKNRIEEERRLLYVAMTRAKKELFLTNTLISFDFYTEKKSRSPFLKEIDKDIESLNTLKYSKKYDDEIYENNYKSNDNLTEGDKILHEIFGEGIILLDEGDIIEVAFSKKYGVKRILKNHKKVKIK